MGLLQRKIPAWAAIAAALLAAGVPVAGSAIAGGSQDPVERARAELASGPSSAAGADRIVRPSRVERSGRLIYGASSFDNPALAQTVAGVRCPKKTQVTGGGVLSGSRTRGQQVVNSSLPIDLGDSNKTDDDGWAAAVENNTAQALQFGVYAICSPNR